MHGRALARRAAGGHRDVLAIFSVWRIDYRYLAQASAQCSAFWHTMCTGVNAVVRAVDASWLFINSR
jgi:hypothetical protein